MAKLKTFAVTVEWTVRREIFVEARRPNGAAEKVLTNEGWREGTQYADDDEGVPFYPARANGPISSAASTRSRERVRSSWRRSTVCRRPAGSASR